MLRRQNAPSQKQVVFERLRPLFTNASERAALERALAREGFELYSRGRTRGVIELSSGRKYRLKTLGLQAAFDRLLDRTKAKPLMDERSRTLLRSRMEQEAREIIDRFDRDGR